MVRRARPEGLHLEFHRLAANGTLHLQQCHSCGRWRHLPRWYCQSCHADEWSFRPVPGRGTLWSAVVTHYPFDPGWADERPYVTAVVELEEGPRLVGALRDLAADDVKHGLTVTINPEPRTDDFTFLWVDVASPNGRAT